MKKNLRHNMNVFQKVEWLKQLASEAIGVSEEAVLKRMLGRLKRKGNAEFKKYGILRFSQQELILDQILKANEISPRTAYIWFLAIRNPEEVLEKGRRDELSQNQMVKLSRFVRPKSDPKHEALGKEIIQDIIRLIEVI